MGSVTWPQGHHLQELQCRPCMPAADRSRSGRSQPRLIPVACAGWPAPARRRDKYDPDHGDDAADQTQKARRDSVHARGCRSAAGGFQGRVKRHAPQLAVHCAQLLVKRKP